ncbi:acyltransferase [Kocuria flava]|uniref:acyltransferase family protein n=1 Tax=Kocuria flava TaxID=446860 RepID=UPI001FF538EE|nr:acyltransferase family protein [Kocuria flava]MCJ8504803.1 acyltransferase [Kocuria flava]
MDIEGLRAIAVLVVLVYHLESDWLPGGFVGVDVFFVISGFLITSHLVSEVERHGHIRFGQFYSRRIRRLIPAAFVVLLATSMGVVLVVPPFVWHQFGFDIASAGAYFVNWVLAARSVDYLAEDAVASPVQHFWSLAVEEQFYLVWPMVIMGLVIVAQRLKIPFRAALVCGGVVVLVTSFLYSQLLVARGDVSAYFMTTTRLWELAVGAISALVIVPVQTVLNDVARTALGVLGFLAILVSVVVLDGENWPATPALIPTLGAAAIILAGRGTGASGIGRILSIRPLVWIGGLSYAIYLWHWPLISLSRYKWSEFSFGQIAFLAALSIVLAWLTGLLVENPIRFSPWFVARPNRGFLLGVASAVLTIALGSQLATFASSNNLQAPSGAVPAGARVLGSGEVTKSMGLDTWINDVEWVSPSPIEALEDVPAIYADGCQQSTTDSGPISCVYGDLDSPKIIALVGDSKAVQWLSALDEFGRENGFRVVTYAKSSCPFVHVDVQLEGDEYPSCARWNESVSEELEALRPAVVVTSQVRRVALDPAGNISAETMVNGLEHRWSQLSQMGAKVVVIGDTPQTGSNIYECVAENSDRLDVCAYDRDSAIASSAFLVQKRAVENLGGSIMSVSGHSVHGSNRSITLLDLTDVVCPSRQLCPPIVGNALIYRSGSHITDTYVRTMEPFLSALLIDAGVGV